MTNLKKPPIFCAIDKPDPDAAIKLCEEIAPLGIGIKLGLEFFNALGLAGLKEIEKKFPDVPIFVDLKYHDIPNTVAGAVRAVTKDFKPAYLNVHASGGLEMMRAARDACPPETKLLAVTLLTSLDENAIHEIGYKDHLSERVIQLAKLTEKAGLDGVVCSSHEIHDIRLNCGNEFVLMVPGIRPGGSDTADQKRVMSPRDAMDVGATHLVIGRPITQAASPRKAAEEILGTL
ncbi:MAG TPA: orotidine-5'-phosphate decarboxylase [Alphaproteobacteria bacterium]|nr:orotidine-5'-phosphate decarboxylase [Alphaproteobacteria bacterium]